MVTDDGYALYATRPATATTTGRRARSSYASCVAATPAARATLWDVPARPGSDAHRHLEIAPVDEPLWLMLTEPRAVRRRIVDGLWVRLVDLPAALTAPRLRDEPRRGARTSPTRSAPGTRAAHRLTEHGCERTDAEPDLALDAAALGAAYLGGTTLRELAEADRVRELSPGALDRASAAFRGAVAPWCPEMF